MDTMRKVEWLNKGNMNIEVGRILNEMNEVCRWKKQSFEGWFFVRMIVSVIMKADQNIQGDGVDM